MTSKLTPDNDTVTIDAETAPGQAVAREPPRRYGGVASKFWATPVRYVSS